MRHTSPIPTMKDISDRTGYTINTVSLALRNSPRVKEETKAGIRAVAKELGYVHNALAGSLSTGSSKMIAIVLGDISNLHFAIKIHELETALRAQEYQVLVINSDEDPKLELEAVKTAVSRQVDGVILCPCQKGRQALELLEQHNVPYVLIGRHYGQDMDAVVWDDEKGGYIAASHLVGQGCKNILFLNASHEISSARERAAGYRRAMEEAGLAPTILCISPMAGQVYQRLDGYLQDHPTPDGIFAFSDLLAWEVACWLEDRGLRVPQDIRIVGFDDILSHIRVPFSLTSISADKQAETSQVIGLLLDRIRQTGKEGFTLHKMDVWVVERGSSL